jgi:hypothetical protein
MSKVKPGRKDAGVLLAGGLPTSAVQQQCQGQSLYMPLSEFLTCFRDLHLGKARALCSVISSGSGNQLQPTIPRTQSCSMIHDTHTQTGHADTEAEAFASMLHPDIDGRFVRLVGHMHPCCLHNAGPAKRHLLSYAHRPPPPASHSTSQKPYKLPHHNIQILKGLLKSPPPGPCLPRPSFRSSSSHLRRGCSHSLPRPGASQSLRFLKSSKPGRCHSKLSSSPCTEQQEGRRGVLMCHHSCMKRIHPIGMRQLSKHVLVTGPLRTSLTMPAALPPSSLHQPVQLALNHSSAHGSCSHVLPCLCSSAWNLPGFRFTGGMTPQHDLQQQRPQQQQQGSTAALQQLTAGGLPPL